MPHPFQSRLPIFARRLARAFVFVPLAAAIALSACTTSKRMAPEMSAAVKAPVTPEDYEKAAEYWGNAYEKSPKSKPIALNYAATLRRLGRTEQAVAVLERATIYHPDDREVGAAYGKALADSGNLDRALAVIRAAQVPDRPDWKLMSAEAAILDQLGRHEEARRLYTQSLDRAPNEPTVLSNLGMSYVLTGELAEAERALRQAAALDADDSRIRQNLALVVGLSGRFDEAEKIASADLSPEEAASNVAYLKSMLSQQNSWARLKDKTEVAALTN